MEEKRTEPRSIFYRPNHEETGEMWDTWVYYRDGTYYLYYLARSGENWDNISMASSLDGIHWTEIGRVLRMGEGVTWMGTGSMWKSPDPSKGGEFQMNFSEWKGPRQTIFFARSNDLLHWERLGAECEFVQDERWYQARGRWDCIWTIPRPGGGLYGYWTASPVYEIGGRFGFGESDDGVTWKALPPPKVHGAGEGEVGAIEKIGEKYYMMFGSSGSMMALVADRPEGPFHAAKKNRSLLAGHTYFSRFLHTPDGLLVNHHSIARPASAPNGTREKGPGRVYMGLLKQTIVDAEGTLRLGWWKGNDKLKQQSTAVNTPGASGTEAPVLMLEDAFDVTHSLILEGELLLPPSGFEARRRGLYIEYAADSGLAILFDAEGRAEFGLLKSDGSNYKVEHRVDRETTFSRRAHFRLVLEHCLLEVYLDDILIECFSLPASATGRIGLVHGGEPNAVRDLTVWRDCR